jgi:hypothetical protein
MENTENTKNKVPNGFWSDRKAGLVDRQGNPIPQQEVPKTEIEQEEVPQTQLANEEAAENTISNEESQVARIARERGIGVANPPIENDEQDEVEETE